MPGAVANTSTWALTNATLPWAVRIADEGVDALVDKHEGFRDAINTDRGRLVNQGVAEAHGLEFQSL